MKIEVTVPDDKIIDFLEFLSELGEIKIDKINDVEIPEALKEIIILPLIEFEKSSKKGKNLRELIKKLEKKI